MHPLLQRRLPQGHSTLALFRSLADDALHKLVADHIVGGRVVFPGAAYLETARAACNATAATSSAAALGGVFFLQPLALGEEGCPAWVECELRSEGSFEVRSGEAREEVRA